MLKKMKDYRKDIETSKKTDDYCKNTVFCIEQGNRSKNIINSVKIN
jgi:hypothetical protein